MDTYVDERLTKEAPVGQEPEEEEFVPTLAHLKQFVNEEFRQIVYIFSESTVDKLLVSDGEVTVGMTRKREHPPEIAYEQPTEEEKEDYTRFKPVTSKYLGILHLKSKKGVPFVKIGDYVKKGQVLAAVETLNIRNEIKADRSGVVVEVFEEEGKPVEFGQIIFLIDPAGALPG